MQLKVRNIEFVYDNDGLIAMANLRFDSLTDGVDTYLNGYVKITMDEYNANATNLPALAELALTKIKAKINA